jgi:thioredoxin 1
MKPTIEVNQMNFKSEVLNSTQLVIVDFWAERCDSCKMVAPLLEEIAVENAGRMKIAKVNMDENPALSEPYHITVIPTLLFFFNGLVYGQIVGIASKKAILSKMEEITAPI